MGLLTVTYGMHTTGDDDAIRDDIIKLNMNSTLIVYTRGMGYSKLLIIP